MKRQPSLFTWVSTIIASGMLTTLGLGILAIVLSALAVVGYGVWLAMAHHDTTLLWAMPVGVLGIAADTATKLPGYVWIALLVVFWLEWRLVRLENSVWSVATAIRRLRRRRAVKTPKDLTKSDE